jgi:hypothetical protein
MIARVRGPIACRQRSDQHHGHAGCDKRHGRHDHLVARTDAEGPQGKFQRMGAVGASGSEFRAMKSSEAVLESADLSSSLGPPLRRPGDREERCILRGIIGRPCRECLRYRGLTAKDGGNIRLDIQHSQLR